MVAENAALRNNTTASQCEKILAWLKAGKSINHLQALDKFGCARLAARVNDLRRAGHDIHAKTINVSNRYGAKCHVAEYRLPNDGQGGTV